MTIIYKIILQEKIFIFAVLSFIFFWLRAVGHIINLDNIGKLIVGLIINIPLFLLASSNMRVHIRTIFGGKYKHLKLSTYTLFICLLYSFFIAENIYSTYSYFRLSILLSTFYFFLPVILLTLGYFLIDHSNESGLTKNIILFIIISLILREFSNILIMQPFSFISHICFQDLTLLTACFHNAVSRFELYGFWVPCLIIIMVMTSGCSPSHIGLEKKLDKRTIVFILISLCLIILLVVLSIALNNRQLATKGLIWNLLTASYNALRVSLFEEIIYRGFLQNYFNNKFASIKDGHIFAIFFTSILFGLYHYPFTTITFFQSFLYGLLFGWLYYKTQNLWAPISVHGFNNLLVKAILL